MLGGTAGTVFGFEVEKLRPVAERIALETKDILVVPSNSELFQRGDVHKPLLV